MNLGVFTLQYFQIVQEGQILALLYMFGRIPLLILLVLDFCILGVFLITNSVSVLVISLFQLSVSFWFRLYRLHVSINLSISSTEFNLLANSCNVLLWFFVSPWYWLLFFLFHFLLHFLRSSLFSSWWALLNVFQFCLSFQQTNSSFH